MTAVVLRSPALWRTVCRPVRTVGDGGGPPVPGSVEDCLSAGQDSR